jgi:dienelactone hydrolase
MKTKLQVGRHGLVCTAGMLLLPLLALVSLRLQAASDIQFSATSYNVTEGASQVEIAVQRTNDLDTVVSVDFTTTNLTATPGADYVDVSTNLTFRAGETNQIVVVPILNDGFVEAVETFQLLLGNPTGGAVLGPRSHATVRILDNDTGLQVEFDQYQAREDEGSVLIGVLRSDDGDFPVTVEYATANGTAKSGEDYTATAGKLEFAAGERLKLFTIPILNDGLKETSQTFRLYLTNVAGTVLGSPTAATITIVDNDPGVQFEYNKYWVRENDGVLTVRVLRGNDVELPPFAVDYATTNLTATAGEDYTETKGTLEFAAGETVKLLTIPITDDEAAESDETFTVTLSHLSGLGALGTITKAAVTILDATGTVAHRFDRIAVLPDQSVQLTLGGGVHKRFKDYFDLYPIEVSTNLVDWTPLVTLQRTNSSTNAFAYTDPGAAKSDLRFYRTVTNNLITAMLKPTGPRPVGLMNRWLTDPTRRNRYGLSTNGSFMVSIWYPAVPESGKLPVSYEDAALLRDPVWVTNLFDREPYMVSHAVPGAPCTTEGSPYPVVLFSHGLGAYPRRSCRSQAAEKAENLASHGYILVGIDHFDTAVPVFPDGTVGNVSTASMTTAGFLDRVRDLSFVLDELVKWNGNDPIFAGRFDLTRVAAMGISWGGWVAPEFCRVDARCRAAILFGPGGPNGDLMLSGLQKPFLQINPSDDSDNVLFTKAVHDAIWFQVSSTQHLNFDDMYWAIFPGSVAASREAARTVNDYTVWFLNKYLKGEVGPALPLPGFPRVINFSQK